VLRASHKHQWWWCCVSRTAFNRKENPPSEWWAPGNVDPVTARRNAMIQNFSSIRALAMFYHSNMHMQSSQSALTNFEDRLRLSNQGHDGLPFS